MKNYIEQADGHYQLDLVNIPDTGNYQSRIMHSEVLKGEATLIKYVHPVEDPNSSIDGKIRRLKFEKTPDAMFAALNGDNSLRDSLNAELANLESKLV
jgi:hypothetical protein